MKIHILPAKDIRLIAAGEIIERPASALRELLDNAVDAKGSFIQVSLEKGGLKSLCVIDNGCGMNREDLPLSIVVHATSKIKTIEDLSTSYALGFRGEALSSIAVCAKISLITRPESQEIGYTLTSAIDEDIQISPFACIVGTKVCLEELFYNMPARKRFLKGESYEQKQCEQIFIERSIAFPQIEFQCHCDGILKHHFLSTNLLGRIQQIFGHVLGLGPLYCKSESTLDYQGFEISVVAARPEYSYHNRRYIQIYVNGRRIQDYSLNQAIIFSYQGTQIQGLFPVAFVFLTIRADLVDFNIHPAKQEVKIKNLSQIHKEIVKLMQENVRPHTVILSPSFSQKEMNSQKSLTYQEKICNTVGSITEDFAPISEIKPFVQAKENTSRLTIPLTQEKPFVHEWRYVGQLFSVFLIVEFSIKMLLIDQHAAHEKILFEQFLQNPPQNQKLLYPIPLDLTNDEKAFVLSQQENLRENGIIIENNPKKNQFFISSAPVQLQEDQLIDFIKKPCTNPQRELCAFMACKQAIKAGTILDKQAIESLIIRTLDLTEPFCPHGRPLWIELKKKQLYEWIKREH